MPQKSLSSLNAGVLSGYLLFGAAPQASKVFSNAKFQKLATSVCFENPITKNAHPISKVRMLTYAEAEMTGCKKRASPEWIKMTGMSTKAFEPPCKGSACCNVSEIVSTNILCDGGGVGTPSCNTSTCTWSYDCTNATIDEDVGTASGGDVISINQYYVYNKKPASSRAVADGTSQLNASPVTSAPYDSLTVGAKIGIAVGMFVVLAVVVLAIVASLNNCGEKTVESV